jgi:hypothetical protein
MECVLYILKANNIPMYKIGITYNLVNRTNTLKSMSPIPISIYEVFRGLNDSVGMEKLLHKHFHKERSHGEWFKLDKAQVKSLKKLVSDFDKESEPIERFKRGRKEQYDLSFSEIIKKYEELFNGGMDFNFSKGGNNRKRPQIAKILNISDSNLARLLTINANCPDLIDEMDRDGLSINDMYQFCRHPH